MQSPLAQQVHHMVNKIREMRCSFQNLQVIARSKSQGLSFILFCIFCSPILPVVMLFSRARCLSLANGGMASESLDEAGFFSHLIEDGNLKPTKRAEKSREKNPNTMSYIDFLCWVHKRIQKKFGSVYT